MMMGRVVVVIGLCVLAACPAETPSRIPKKPNNELIVGEFERHPPDGKTAYRFGDDGSFIAAKSRAELEHTPHLSEGVYQVEGDKLTFTAARGECGDAKVGVYKVVISKVGIRFVKVDDACAWRGRLDGQTLWRVK